MEKVTVMLRYSTIFLLLPGLVLTGCAVGPNFHSPPAPKTQTYTSSPLPANTVSAPGAGGNTQRFMMGQDIPAEWWTLFHCQALSDLIRQGLSNSPNVAAAQAALRQAQENFYADVGTVLFPTVDANASALRQKTSSASQGQETSSTTFNLYNASVNVSYNLDIFGKGRRGLELLRSQVDQQRFELEATYLTLAANIVTTAITEASLSAQIQATQELIKSQEDQLQIINKQFRVGAISHLDVLAQETQLAQTRALLPGLEKSLAQNRHALAVLVGVPPSESKFSYLHLDEVQLPAELPVSLPPALVWQRPDVRVSEALLQQASAQVGIATANLLPQLSLSGSYGSTANAPQNLLRSGTDVWSLGTQLLQPIFHGGALRAQRRAAIAGYEQAAAQYKQTVLQAFQNVADTLRALEMDAQALQAQTAAEVAAGNTLALAKKQFKLGAISYLDLLNAERQYQQALINRIQAQAARYTDTAALFQALGGGWWNRKV